MRRRGPGEGSLDGLCGVHFWRGLEFRLRGSIDQHHRDVCQRAGQWSWTAVGALTVDPRAVVNRWRPSLQAFVWTLTGAEGLVWPRHVAEGAWRAEQESLWAFAIFTEQRLATEIGRKGCVFSTKKLCEIHFVKWKGWSFTLGGNKSPACVKLPGCIPALKTSYMVKYIVTYTVSTRGALPAKDVAGVWTGRCGEQRHGTAPLGVWHSQDTRGAGQLSLVGRGLSVHTPAGQRGPRGQGGAGEDQGAMGAAAGARVHWDGHATRRGRGTPWRTPSGDQHTAGDVFFWRSVVWRESGKIVREGRKEDVVWIGCETFW